MKKVFEVGSFSKAIVSKADCLLKGKQAYKVKIISHDDTDDVEYETLVAAKNYREAAETGFEAYLNY
jgi:hypothetical protein